MKKVHGRAGHDAARRSHSEAFDQALDDALAKASEGFDKGTHKVKIEFRAEMEVKNPGRIQSYVVSISSDDDPPDS
jgi:hypothetical protein